MSDYALVLKRIGTAFLIFVFNFNIGSLNLIPNFIGYLFIYNSLHVLEKYEESSKLMKPLTLTLCIYNGFTWFFDIFQVSLNEYIINMMFAIFSIYVYYHLLTSIGQICASYGSVYTNRIFHLRNIITVLQTMTSLSSLLLNAEENVMFILLAIVYIVIIVCMKITLNHCANEAMNIRL